MRFKSKILLLIVISLVLILLSGCIEIQRLHRVHKKADKVDNGWEKIGERKVNLKGEKDVISGFGKGRFNRIRIIIRDSAIELYDMIITFGNGEKFSPETRLVFAKDTESRIIDLQGKKRFIKKIEFFYKSRNIFTGKATVEVWGKK